MFVKIGDKFYLSKKTSFDQKRKSFKALRIYPNGKVTNTKFEWSEDIKPCTQNEISLLLNVLKNNGYNADGTPNYSNSISRQIWAKRVAEKEKFNDPILNHLFITAYMHGLKDAYSNK